MKKISLLLAILATLSVVAVAFAADVWAASVEDSLQGPAYSGSISPARSNPNAALGAPDNNGSDETTFFSLGNGGHIDLKLDDSVSGGLAIYEATWGCNAGYANETANVYVSVDGVDWNPVGTADNKGDKTCYNGSGFITSLALDQCVQYVRVEDAGAGTAGDGFDLDAVGGEGICQLTITVDIDIKPGSDPNSINLCSRGIVPVGILTIDNFDATTVDPGSVTFAGSNVAVKGKGALRYSFEDIDGDGDLDMIVQFPVENLTLDSGSTIGKVSGTTTDGISFEGTDSVNIVKDCQ